MPRLTKPTAQHSAPAGFTRYAAAAALLLGCADDHYLGDLVDQHPGDYQGAGGTAGDQDFAAAPLLGEPEVSMTLQKSGPSPNSARVLIGDVDGDGFEDFATVEQDYGYGAIYVHLRYGGPRPVDSLDGLHLAQGGSRLLLDGSTPTLAAELAPAGDVDADGYADFLVGPYECDRGDQEALYLVYGGPARIDGIVSLSDVGVRFVNSRLVPGTDYVCTGHFQRLSFGTVGDFDGDGFDDFIASDPRRHVIDDYPEPGPALGSVAYVFYGRVERWAAGSLSDADARLHAPGSLDSMPLQDVNGDGLGDIILGVRLSGPKPPEYFYTEDPGGFHWLPGRAQRLSGDMDVASAGTPVSLSAFPPQAAGDLDGDGLDDVILYDEAHTAHVFYGAPGLFDAEIDLTRAAATFANLAGAFELSAAGDLDGDGDDELIAGHHDDRGGPTAWSLAVLSGTASRMSGAVELAQFANPLEKWDREVERVLPAGDLDNDGAGDIVTLSKRDREGGAYPFEPVMLHIHYGIPGGVLAVPH